MSDLGNKEIMGKNISYYLDLHSKTRQDMCDELGFKYSTVTDWINGNTYPRIDSIEKMANWFGIKKSDLVENRHKTYNSVLMENHSDYNVSELSDSYYLNEETREMARELYENKELRLLFNAGRKAKPEDLKMVSDMLIRLKKAENHEE